MSLSDVKMPTVTRPRSRFAPREPKVVKIDYDLPTKFIESYLEKHDSENIEFNTCYEKFKENKIDINNATLIPVLNFFLEQNMFISNKELYEQVVTFLDYAVTNNQLHRTNRNNYEDALKRALFQENSYCINSNIAVPAEPSFAQYEDNNFRKITDNEFINCIYTRGGAIFINSDMKIYIKLSNEHEGKPYHMRKAEKLLHSMLGISIKILENSENTINDINTDISKITPTISFNELMVVHGEKFRPFILKEYFEESGVTYRNIFTPTKYMRLEGKHTRLPKSILDLIYHLAGYKKKKCEYFINWLAFFFKYLKKSQVAIALIGSQGAGKGILFALIGELFGKNYCVTINDESLNTKYKAKMFRGKLFYNFDEATLNTSKKNDSFIKAIITNSSISLEEKNVTMAEETELYAQCLFSSNHMKALNIPKDDRRKTVILTGENLAKVNFLGYGSYENLKAAIDNDMEEFARYLKNYAVDISLANTVLETPERSMMINASIDHFEALHKAIITMDISYFDELQDIDYALYSRIQFSFERREIDRADIALAYNALYTGRKVSTKEIMEKFRDMKPYNIFSKENLYHRGNSHYFRLS